MTLSQLRLAYVLHGVSRSGRVLLLPQLRETEAPASSEASAVGQTALANVPSRSLTEVALKSMRARLHPLDQAIVQEICAGAQYGQITDSALARLLPLLAQRQTYIDGQRLRINNSTWVPRVRLQSMDAAEGGAEAAEPLTQPAPQPAPQRAALLSWQLLLQLHNAQEGFVALQTGRLIAGGSQAFFLRGHQAAAVSTGNPSKLAEWARKAQLYLTAEQLTPSGRDALVHDLQLAGVPASDLNLFAVQRGAPERIVLRLLPSPAAATPSVLPQVHAVVEVVYQGVTLLLEGQRSGTAYVSLPTAGLVERDLLSEDEICRQLRLLGFRFDKGSGHFIAEDEAALLAADAQRQIFPATWEIDRRASPMQFRRDLTLHTQVKMLQERGLLDVQVRVKTSDTRAAVAPTTALVSADTPAQEHAENDADSADVQALVDMQELLTWLHSGKTYVRLADGTYAAPSARFRQGLRILGDMGADNARALISPLCIGLLRAIGDHTALQAVDTATRAWLQELASDGQPRSIEPPAGLRAVLRDYQRRGVDWLMMLHRHRLTGILADDMGLGKTLQTLALLLLVRQQEGQKPSLVVAPTSVVGVWRDEAAHFAPDLQLALWYGAPEMRRHLDYRNADLIVTSYGILRRDAERFAEMQLRYVILDEAQSAKNAASHNAAAIRKLQSERRLALSGTPLENRPEELWSVFDFLAPGFLGSLRQFRKAYATPISRGEEDNINLLRLRLQPLILRRLKTEVAQELPEKVEQTLRCDMGTAQRALYDHIAGELRDSVRHKIARVGIQSAQLDILAALTRLRQICCDPFLLPVPEGTKVPPSAKLQMFEELLQEVLAAGRCVVVFSQFVTMQRRLIEVIERLGVKPLWLHGGSTSRDKIVAAFQDPQGPPVIVVSLRAGGTGVTLTRADTVVHYDPWWNPAVERQATDRTHRLGQNKTVYVYKLICTRSIEDRVAQLAQKKEALAEKLLGSEGGAAAKKISQEEVLALLN